jgi:hypothetical protein
MSAVDTAVFPASVRPFADLPRGDADHAGAAAPEQRLLLDAARSR